MKRVVFMMVLVAVLGARGATALKGKLRNTDAVVISEDDAAALAALAVERAARIESERLLDLARSAGDAAGRDAHALNSNRIAAVQGAMLSSNAVRQAEMVLNSNRITAVQGAMLSSNAVFSAGIAANSNRLDVAQTNRVEKLWSSPTNYIDGAGVFYRVNMPDYILTAAPAQITLPVPPLKYWITVIDDHQMGYFRDRYRQKNYPNLLLDYNSETKQWKYMTALTSGERFQPSVSISTSDGTQTYVFTRTNYLSVIDRAATTNELAAAIATIKPPPANSSAGWLLFDSGSNMWLRVSVSNLSFTVEEAL